MDVMESVCCMGATITRGCRPAKGYFAGQPAFRSPTVSAT